MQNKENAVIYIGNFRFPMGDAVAKRAFGLGKAFVNAGYKVMCIDEDPTVETGTISKARKYDKFEYYSIHHSANALEHYLFLKDLKLVKQKLQKWNEVYNIVALILCGTKCALFADGIVRFAKKNRIAVFADSMDWLTSHTGNRLFDILKQLDTTLEIKVVNKKMNGIICISKYLANYYHMKGEETVTIPPLSPYDRPKMIAERNGKIRLIYAGIPCRLGRELINPSDAKDRLDLAIKMLYELAKDGVDFEFIVYGMTKEDYDIVFPHQNQATDFLVQNRQLFFMGKQEEMIVKEAVADADFTILLRENNRTSMAGFPTKVSESITLGTPVITTDTSDIKTYLSNDVCYFVDLHNPFEAKEMLRRILSLDTDERTRNKISCLKNDSFEPEKYTEVLRSFIKRCSRV